MAGADVFTAVLVAQDETTLTLAHPDFGDVRVARPADTLGVWEIGDCVRLAMTVVTIPSGVVA